MKRSALSRSSGLQRSSLKRRHLTVVDEPGRAEWTQQRFGRCAVCGAEGRIVRHHIFDRQAVRRVGGDQWDLRNALDVGAHWLCHCHSNHSNAFQRMPLSLVSDEALDFGIETFGSEPAALFLASHYSGDWP